MHARTQTHTHGFGSTCVPCQHHVPKHQRAQPKGAPAGAPLTLSSGPLASRHIFLNPFFFKPLHIFCSALLISPAPFFFTHSITPLSVGVCPLSLTGSFLPLSDHLSFIIPDRPALLILHLSLCLLNNTHTHTLLPSFPPTIHPSPSLDLTELSLPCHLFTRRLLFFICLE